MQESQRKTNPCAEQPWDVVPNGRLLKPFSSAPSWQLLTPFTSRLRGADLLDPLQHRCRELVSGLSAEPSNCERRPRAAHCSKCCSSPPAESLPGASRCPAKLKQVPGKAGLIPAICQRVPALPPPLYGVEKGQKCFL